MPKSLRALVLGSAAGGGLPQWNCGCSNCVKARLGEEIVPQTQSSIAVSANNTEWAILNTSPDIRTQIQDNKQLHPTGLRDSPVKSVLLTNGDIDHIAGLLILREKQPFNVFLTVEIAKLIAENPIFNALDPQFVKFHEIVLDTPFELVSGITAELFSVPGKVPLFMEKGDVATDIEGEQTVGVKLYNDSGCLWYIPGCAKLTDDLKRRLQGEAIVFFDGTVFNNDEMKKAKVGAKTGARMGHISMAGADGSLEGFAKLNVGRKIYVHINNTNPVWDKQSVERKTIEQAGWEIGFDGMEVQL
ncbi:MAG: pyrroloquinoline quinone biosynthesis protein PqqB [Hyphomicrobiales bacterium]